MFATGTTEPDTSWIVRWIDGEDRVGQSFIFRFVNVQLGAVEMGGRKIFAPLIDESAVVAGERRAIRVALDGILLDLREIILIL